MISRSDTTVLADGVTPEPGVYVTVKTSAGAYVLLYDSGGAPLANPFVTGSDGSFTYWVENEGTYVEEYRTTKTGSVRTTIRVRISGADYSAPSIPPGDISLPTPWVNVLNVNPYWNGTTVAVDTNPYDLLDFENAGGVTQYYVSWATGNDANNGLTTGTARKTLTYAIANATSPAVINLLDAEVGVTSLDPAVSASSIYSGKLKIKGRSARTLFHCRREEETVSTFAWAASGTAGAYVSTAARCAGIFRAHFDGNLRDEHDIPRPLTLAADVATCQATPGTFFWSSPSLYIHMWDGRIPDPDNGWIYHEARSLYNFKQSLTTSAGIILLENLEFMANAGTLDGIGNMRYQNVTTGSANSAMFGMRNCISYGGNANGFQVYDAAIAAIDNCHTAYNHADGFNYHSFVTTGAKGSFMTVYEVNCTARHSGFTGFPDQPALSASANATTAHDSIRIMRINPFGADCHGAPLADVNGVLSVNLNPNMAHPGSGASPKSLYWHDNYLGAGPSSGMYIWRGRGNNDGDATVNLLDNTAQSGGQTGQIYLKFWRGQTNGAVVGTLKDWSGNVLANLAAAA